MKNLLQTHSVSWAQSVKLSLESEGIEAVVLDENAPGYMGFRFEPGPLVYVAMGATTLAFIGGFVLIALGWRADKR